MISRKIPARIIGISGGSGSGKTRLANYLFRALRGRAALLSHDWYYRDRAGMPEVLRQKVNFDHPNALETRILVKHLQALSDGREVATPRYDYATSSRMKESVPVAGAAIVLIEGLFILHEERLRRLLDLSVFVDVPADVRLARRIRRDVIDRGIPVAETLRLYERFVRPMHERFVQPSARYATHVWRPLEDRTFPSRFKDELRGMLS
jgi:uridine kinase